MLSEVLPHGNPGSKVFDEVRIAIKQCVARSKQCLRRGASADWMAGLAATSP
jgi:hypothetical protein